MPKSPRDPFTQLQEHAASLHEYFSCLVNAGFTQQEALHLTSQVLLAVASRTQE